MTIIGISPDVRQQNPSETTTDPLVFIPYRFENYRGMAIVMRTDGSPVSLAGALRTEVQQLDQDLPLYDVDTLDVRFDKGRWYLRVFGTMFLIFAAVATGMAGVGVYGVMAHDAGRRTREIGVRLALGANGGNILRLVLRRGMVQLGLGVVLGLKCAVAVCRLMGKLLFGVSPTDPATYVTVAVILAVTGIVGVWLPARKAAKLSPVQALRYE